MMSTKLKNPVLVCPACQTEYPVGTLICDSDSTMLADVGPTEGTQALAAADTGLGFSLDLIQLVFANGGIFNFGKTEIALHAGEPKRVIPVRRWQLSLDGGHSYVLIGCRDDLGEPEYVPDVDLTSIAARWQGPNSVRAAQLVRLDAGVGVCALSKSTPVYVYPVLPDGTENMDKEVVCEFGQAAVPIEDGWHLVIDNLIFAFHLGPATV